MATQSNHSDKHNRKEQVQSLLSNAVANLCQKLLMYDSEMCIEGLLGITLDQKDIVLVNIREVIREASCGMSQKPNANDTHDRTFPRESSPLPGSGEVVNVSDTLVSSQGNASKQRCPVGNQRRVSCEAADSRPESNRNVDVSTPRNGLLGEPGGAEEGTRRRQGGSGTDWVSDIIHNTIGPGKDADFEADNGSPINLDASLYDDPNQSVNYTAMSVGMDTIRASGETRRCGQVVAADIGAGGKLNGDTTTNRILLPEPIMQTEKQVSQSDSKCTSQQPGPVVSGMIRSNIRHFTDLTGTTAHCSHNADSMTSTGHANILDHNDKVRVKMEPLDNTAFSHLVGLTNVDPKIECAYTCHLCRRAFSHKRTLMRHQRTHHLGQKHFCPFCNKPFGRKDTMRRHSLMYHPVATCSQMSLHEHIPIHSSLQ